MRVDQVKLPGADAVGHDVEFIYKMNPPDYAIYRSKGQVLVHFADDPDRAKTQAVALGPLGTLRGDISGLIDGWRNNPERKTRAAQLEQNTAEALDTALQGDVVDARQSLQQIKQQILDERISIARFEYLIAAVACTLAMIVLTRLALLGFFAHFFYPNADADYIRTAVGAGTIGAFFSIATGLRNRTVLPDLHWRDNAADAALRILIGAIGAGVILAFYDIGFVKFQVGSGHDASLLTDSAVFAMGFLAGFSERLVPDMLAKAGDSLTAANSAAASKPISEAASSAASQLSQPAAPASGDDDDDDGCPSDAPPAPGEPETKDEDLPAAEGGLATRPAAGGSEAETSDTDKATGTEASTGTDAAAKTDASGPDGKTIGAAQKPVSEPAAEETASHDAAPDPKTASAGQDSKATVQSEGSDPK